MRFVVCPPTPISFHPLHSIRSRSYGGSVLCSTVKSCRSWPRDGHGVLKQLPPCCVDAAAAFQVSCFFAKHVRCQWHSDIVIMTVGQIHPGMVHRPRAALTDFAIILSSLSVLLINVPFIIQGLHSCNFVMAYPKATPRLNGTDASSINCPRPCISFHGEHSANESCLHTGSPSVLSVNVDDSESSHASQSRFHDPPSNLRNFIHPAFFEASGDLCIRPGRSSGTCIAIRARPRLHVDSLLNDSDSAATVPDGHVSPWRFAEQLLRSLESKRARSPIMLEKSLWAVVLASACQVRMPAEAADDVSRKVYNDRLSHFSPASISSLLEALAQQAAVTSTAGPAVCQLGMPAHCMTWRARQTCTRLSCCLTLQRALCCRTWRGSLPGPHLLRFTRPR